ncbi:hypothetical protein K8Q94_01725 [Candidatus Nomurabacteria bacterium]|nr:hypothetical protein [Candidatus Nomurabacteria bacterium]
MESLEILEGPTMDQIREKIEGRNPKGSLSFLVKEQESKEAFLLVSKNISTEVPLINGYNHILKLKIEDVTTSAYSKELREKVKKIMEGKAKYLPFYKKGMMYISLHKR